jgi:hypothetical protein
MVGIYLYTLSFLINKLILLQNTNASLLMWTDFAYTIIFLIFCIALKKRSARLRQEHATKTPVPSQYTLEVSNIPDTIVSDLEIIEFF